MSKTHDITVIAGLSGVGKTYVIEALMRYSNDYAHFSAGTLIKRRMANIDRLFRHGFGLRFDLGNPVHAFNIWVFMGVFMAVLRNGQFAIQPDFTL